MSKYGWLITEDLLEGAEAVGVRGPRSTPYTAAECKERGVEFQMLDDDGEVYYRGRFIGDSDGEEGFAPLEDFGMPNAGCTSIQYKNAAGEWETL